MEALEIQNLLKANGIESVVAGSTTIPSVEFQVQVPRSLLEDAERVLAEAREAGPAAADEAEAAEEAGGSAGRVGLPAGRKRPTAGTIRGGIPSRAGLPGQ